MTRGVVSLSVITTKGTLFESLAQVFDLMITFEFTNNLRSILQEFCPDMTEELLNQIVTEKQLDENFKNLVCPKYLVSSF